MGTGRITVTPTGIEVTDENGRVRMRMGALGDDMPTRARLYVHGVPGVTVEVTSTENWSEVNELRKIYGQGRTIYMWVDSQGDGTQWRMAMAWSWKYAEPPKEIALAHYLLEGE